MVARIEKLRRDKKWSARRTAHELSSDGTTIAVRTISRHLALLGLNRRKFLDPTGESNREPRRIVARWPGLMVHVDAGEGRADTGRAVAGVPTASALTRRRPSNAPRLPEPAPATCTCTPPSTGSPALPTPRL